MTTRRSSRGVVRASVVGGVLIAALAVMPVVRADNFAAKKPNGETGCASGVYQADSFFHDFEFQNLSSVGSTMTTWAMDNVIDPTAMEAAMDLTPGGGTDVRVTDYDFTTLCGHNWYDAGDGEAVVGLYTCENKAPDGACNHSFVRFEQEWIDAGTTSERRSLACHELGHSVGLQHRSDSSGCMPSTINGVTNWSLHDRNHVNAHY